MKPHDILPGLLRPVLVLALTLPLTVPLGAAKAPKAPTAKGQLPPLIDRDKFFGNPQIAGA